jgi:DNA-binding transcriptional LysR family regulator
VRSGDKESLRIGVLRTFAAHPICRLVKVFGRVRPDVTVQLIDGRNVDLEARLSEDKIDAFIARIDAPESKFAHKFLLKERFVVAVAKDHRFARENAIKLSDIDGEPFVARTGCEIYDQTATLLTELDIRMRYAYKTDQDYRALSLVAAGVGIAIIPELFYAHGVENVDIGDFDFSRNIGIFWKASRMNEILEEFLVCASAHDW